MATDVEDPHTWEISLAWYTGGGFAMQSPVHYPLTFCTDFISLFSSQPKQGVQHAIFVLRGMEGGSTDIAFWQELGDLKQLKIWIVIYIKELSSFGPILPLDAIVASAAMQDPTASYLKRLWQALNAKRIRMHVDGDIRKHDEVAWHTGHRNAISNLSKVDTVGTVGTIAKPIVFSAEWEHI